MPIEFITVLKAFNACSSMTVLLNFFFFGQPTYQLLFTEVSQTLYYLILTALYMKHRHYWCENDIIEMEWLSRGHKACSLQLRTGAQTFRLVSDLHCSYHTIAAGAPQRCPCMSDGQSPYWQKQHFLLYEYFVSMTYSFEAPEICTCFPSAAQAVDDVTVPSQGYPITVSTILVHIPNLWYTWLNCFH